MKISVVVPIYNVEKFLDTCVESILKQTFNEFEVLLVDDGSTDDSGMIADKWGRIDSRVEVFHKENGGLASARNYGINRAKGEYICFIDSDDWIESTYLEELLDIAQKTNADVVVCDYIKNHGEDVVVQAKKTVVIEQSGYEAIANIYTSNYVKYVVAWNKLYRRSIFEHVKYTEGMIHEDEAICGFIYCHADKVVGTNRVLYNYRVNNNTSIMSKRYSLKRLDILRALEMRMELFKEKQYVDYYEKDSFKYMYKILLNIIELKKLDGDYLSLIKELKKKYWEKYREARDFSWSLKRRMAMLIFGIFPKLYLLRYKPN